jgi:hypothetical protein
MANKPLAGVAEGEGGPMGCGGMNGGVGDISAAC